MYKKKANITVSFSWIFMIIIGTFFIVVAYNVISTYQQNEEAKYELELKNTLRNVFNLVGTTTGIEEEKMEPLGRVFRNSEVEIICFENNPLLSINGRLDANNEYLRNYPTFMTYIKQGRLDETYLAVGNFRMPFKTSNLLAIVSKNNYIILDDSSTISLLFIEKFRKTGAFEDLTLIVTNINSFDSDFYESLRRSGANSIMFISDEHINIDPQWENLRQRAYHLQIENPGNSYGNIIYKDKDGNSFTFPYIDFDNSLSLITMAAFSSPGTFNCSYNRLFDLTTSAYEFKINKTQYFISLLDNSVSLCSPSMGGVGLQNLSYVEVLEKLEEIKLYIETNNFNNPVQLYNLIRQLDDLQKDKLEVFNCPYIY